MNDTFFNVNMEPQRLKDDQWDCVDYDGDKTLLIKGYAGSGKSVALQRIAKKYIEEYETNYDPSAYHKVLILTYNKPLACATSQLLGINGDGKRRFIKVKTVNKHLFDICVDIVVDGKKLDVKVIRDEKTHLQFIRDALKEHRSQYGTCRLHKLPECDANFWKEEFEWMKGMNVTTADEDYYMSLERRGRGTNIHMSESDRHSAFQIFCCYRQLLKRNGLVDWGDFALYVVRHPDQIPAQHRYDHVLIDEAQDFSLAQMKALMNVYRVDMTIAMDINQRLYNKHWTSKQLGIETRIKKLKQTMRTTKQIDAFAESLRKANDAYTAEVADASDHVIPKWDGPKPTVVILNSLEEEKELLMDLTELWLEKYSKHTVGIITSKNLQLDNISSWLKDRDIRKEIIKGDQDFNITKPGVKLVTTHSAKGLEFTRVIIPQFVDGNYPYSRIKWLSIEKEREDFEIQERNRAYVAVTRAQQRLIVTCVKGSESPFLKDIDRDTYNLIYQTEDLEVEDIIDMLEGQPAQKEEIVGTVNTDHDEFKQVLLEVLGTLREREEIIIRQRFGLDDGKKHTLEEVGTQFGVTRERIRQIEKKALRKLKHPSRFNKIKVFVDPDLDIADILTQFMDGSLVVKKSTQEEVLAMEPPAKQIAAAKGTIEDDLPIEKLGLSNRSYNCIKRAGINTVGELCNMRLEEMEKVRNLGTKSLSEIITVLEECGRSLKNG